jgi:hypothetical protein
MNTRDLTGALTTLLSEVLDGAPKSGAYMLNRGDQGLLRSLDYLTADAASTARTGGASIAAHVEHLRYGLSLLNRWARGEDPWADADWSASWKTIAVSDAAWRELRNALRTEAHRWLDEMRKPREIDEAELNGMIGSIAHVAYHLGAIRQIDRRARGPAATD